MEQEVTVKGNGVFINQSRLTDFLNCQELYQLRYEHDGTGLATKGRELSLSVGQAYHKGIAAYYHKGRDVEQGVIAARDCFDVEQSAARLMADESQQWQDSQQLLEVMVRRYDKKWANEALTILATEVSGQVQLGSSPHHLIFRTDVLCQELGSIKLIDHKTKGRTPGANEIAKIHSDIQPSAYCYAVRKKIGARVEGMKIRFQIKRADYPMDRALFEEFTARSDRDLARFEEEAIWACDRILELRKSGKWLHNWSHCLTYGECRMRRICLHHREPSVISMFEKREADYVNAAEEVTND
jgi:hypothetical protein